MQFTNTKGRRPCSPFRGAYNVGQDGPMLNLSKEVARLRDRGLITPEAAAWRMAVENREIFSVYPEVRLMAWGGAVLVAAGVAVLVGRNYERIGPLAIAIAVAVAAIACYLFAWSRRANPRPSLIDDYIVLLGALLISADLGFIEKQILQRDSEWFLLVLAVLHAIAAYAFDSRLVLSLSLTALASWFGVSQAVFEPVRTATSAFICSAVILVWRAVDARFRTTFTAVFDHYAGNIAFLAALTLTFDRDTRVVGVLITLVLAAVVIRHGFAKKSEAFVIYAYAYAVIAVDILLVDVINEEVMIFLYLVVSTIAAIAGLFVLHARFRSLQ